MDTLPNPDIVIRNGNGRTAYFCPETTRGEEWLCEAVGPYRPTVVIEEGKLSAPCRGAIRGFSVPVPEWGDLISRAERAGLVVRAVDRQPR